MMKLICLICLSLSLYAMEKSQIQALIMNLQSFSKTQSKQIIKYLDNPFKNNNIQTEQPLELYAIINDKALINEEWLKKGESINGYKILEIHSQYIKVQRDKIFYIISVDGSINQIQTSK